MRYVIETWMNGKRVCTGVYCRGLTRHGLVYAVLSTISHYHNSEEYTLKIRCWPKGAESYEWQKIVKQITHFEAQKMVTHFTVNGGDDLLLYGFKALNVFTCNEINQMFKGRFSLSSR